MTTKTNAKQAAVKSANAKRVAAKARASKPVAKPVAKSKAIAPELTPAQETLCQQFTLLAAAEVNAGSAMYQAIVTAGKGDKHTPESIALAVKHAYLRAGATEQTARGRSSEAKKVVFAIRAKKINPADYTRLYAAAKNSPAVTSKGAKARATDKPGKATSAPATKAPTSAEHLATIQTALNGLRESSDDEATLELIAELADMAATLTDLLISAPLAASK